MLSLQRIFDKRFGIEIMIRLIDQDGDLFLFRFRQNCFEFLVRIHVSHGIVGIQEDEQLRILRQGVQDLSDVHAQVFVVGDLHKIPSVHL